MTQLPVPSIGTKIQIPEGHKPTRSGPTMKYVINNKTGMWRISKPNDGGLICFLAGSEHGPEIEVVNISQAGNAVYAQYCPA